MTFLCIRLDKLHLASNYFPIEVLPQQCLAQCIIEPLVNVC